MTTKVLINPSNFEIAARMQQTQLGKQVQILDERILRIIQAVGIIVPRDFTPEKVCHIYLDHPDPITFAEAFEQHFFPSLAERGFYWTSEKEYKAIRSTLHDGDLASQLVERHVLSLYK